MFPIFAEENKEEGLINDHISITKVILAEYCVDGLFFVFSELWPA